MSQHGLGNAVNTAEIAGEILMLYDEGQAKIVLGKIRSSCEGVLLTTQENISRDLAPHPGQLEPTLPWALDDAMRPIEQRVKEELNHAGFRVRIRFSAFHTTMFSFNTRQLFNEAIGQDISVENVPSIGGVVRDAFSRWLSQPNQGRDDYVETKTRYLTDMDVLHKNLVQYVFQFCQQIRKTLAAQVNIFVTAGTATPFADFPLYLAQLQASLSENLMLCQQNESAMNAIDEQLQQRITIAVWLYEDSRLLRDDINALFATEHT